MKINRHLKVVLSKNADNVYTELNKIVGEEIKRGIKSSFHQTLLRSIKRASELLKENPAGNKNLWEAQLLALKIVERLDKDALKPIIALLQKHPDQRVRQWIQQKFREKAQNIIRPEPSEYELVFIKGGGITQKADSGAAGSHGIGKNAVFNLSQFRTAFYASIDIDNQSSFFGKSILQSHLRSDDETSQGTGYFSEQPENKPILKRIDKLV